jgi:hypothetical protein
MHLADHRGSATDSAVSLTAHLLQRGDNAVFAVRKGDDAVALPVAGLTALRILRLGPGLLGRRGTSATGTFRSRQS